jgi:HPt (histidine-containing phosphotransfer) domain-containing protein
MPDNSSKPPLKSDLAGDPEMLELVQMFLAEMPDRLRELEGAWSAEHREALSRLSHQLKGCCAGYGFPSVGQAAGALESGLKDPSRELESLKREFESLVELCSRAAV